MQDLETLFTTGTRLALSVNAPCGYTMIEGAVVANVSGRYLKIVFPAATNPKMDHIPTGTQISLMTETADSVFAFNGLISSHDERPFVWIKVLEQLPAMEKRRHQRISMQLPMYCSVVDDSGSMQVIYDGKKSTSDYAPADLSLSAGGFKLKTPFAVKNDTMAIVVFFSPDESEWVVPVFSRAIYSHPAPASENYLTGFRFSLISSTDRRKIDTLVNTVLTTNEPRYKARKLPSCLTRIRSLA